jgi:hypothetical protein
MTRPKSALPTDPRHADFLREIARLIARKLYQEHEQRVQKPDEADGAVTVEPPPGLDRGAPKCLTHDDHSGGGT